MKSHSDWIRVSAKNPCPICERADWCTIAPDGTAACCMRMQSDRPLANGGYYHWLTDQRPRQPAYRPRPRPRPKPSADLTETLTVWQSETTTAQLQHLAQALGVSQAALRDIGAVRSPESGAWAFPMCDPDGKIVGIRLRADNGRKWAVKGSRAGLMYGEEWAKYATVLICEGPTDTAAAMTLGFGAVGRPSCRGQEDMVRDTIRSYRGDVVIVSDRDSPKKRPDGTLFFPGREGAEQLAKSLKRPLRIILPPCKDIRAWLRTGATAIGVQALIGAARWRNLH